MSSKPEMPSYTGDCLLVTDDHLPHLGGSRIYNHKVAALLAGRMAVVTKDYGGAAPADSEAGYPIRRVMLRGRAYKGPALIGEYLDYRALSRAARQSFPEARVYLAGEMIPAAFVVRALSRRRGVLYGLIIHDEPLAGAGRVEARFRKAVIRGAAAVIVSSSFPRARVMEIAPDARVFFAPPGVEADTFSPAAPDKAVMDRYEVSVQRYILSAGRLVGYKNIAAAVDTVATLREEGLKLVVVGEGPERKALEAYTAALGVADRVVFAGRVSREDLVELYRGALVYVFPSRRAEGLQHEGIGMAALEAAACGCPVIASTATSAGDFVEHGRTGLMFDPEAPGAFAAAVGSLLSDPQTRIRRAAACMERVRREFTWENTARVILDAVEYIRDKKSPLHGRPQ